MSVGAAAAAADSRVVKTLIVTPLCVIRKAKVRTKPPRLGDNKRRRGLEKP